MKTTSWRIVRTLIISYLFSAVLLLVLTFLLYRFHLPEEQITVGIYAVYVLSCFLGGFLAGKAMKTRRFFWGMIVGLLYFTALFLMSSLQNQSMPTELSHMLSVLSMCLASGMAGGMVS